VPGVRRSDNRMLFHYARSLSSELSDASESPEAKGGGVDDVFANAASPLRLRRLRDAMQEYLSQRCAMPEVLGGVGEGAEPAVPTTQISAGASGTAGRLMINRAMRFAVEVQVEGRRR
jgi:hypothetical protein